MIDTFVIPVDATPVKILSKRLKLLLTIEWKYCIIYTAKTLYIVFNETLNTIYSRILYDI